MTTHPNLDALVAVIRDVRPDWSAPAIRAALLDPAVRVHAYPDVIAAAVALARDPDSRYPGRLGHRGPWWPSVSARTATPPPYRPDRAKDPVATERGAALARAELAKAQNSPERPPRPITDGRTGGGEGDRPETGTEAAQW